MTDITRILSEVEEGDPSAADQLLPLVYDELKKLARAKIAQEKPGQTLQATSLVHEVYLRLVKNEQGQHWDSRGHFFAAAAEAMRRILVEQARRKHRLKRRGNLKQVELNADAISVTVPPDQLLAIDDALGKLAREDPVAANIVKLRYFLGLSVEEAARNMGLSRATAYRHWTYAKAWLRCELQ